MAESKTDSRVVDAGAEMDVRPGMYGLTYKLSLDVSEALAGLKAIQREARKATAAVAELQAKASEVSPQITINTTNVRYDGIERIARDITARLRKQTSVKL